jgi:hypothetical protein
LVGKAPVTQNVSVVQRGGQAPGFLLDGHFLVPRRAGLSPVVRSVPVTGTVLSHTREFLVTQPEPNDPFTLRIFFMEP